MLNILITETENEDIKALYILKKQNTPFLAIQYVPPLWAPLTADYPESDLENMQLPFELVDNMLFNLVCYYLKRGDVKNVMEIATVNSHMLEKVFLHIFPKRFEMTTAEQIFALRSLFFAFEKIMEIAVQGEDLDWLPQTETFTYELYLDEKAFNWKFLPVLKRINYTCMRTNLVYNGLIRKSVWTGERPCDMVWLYGSQNRNYFRCETFCRPVFVFSLRKANGRRGPRNNLLYPLCETELHITLEPLVRLFKLVFGKHTTICFDVGPSRTLMGVNRLYQI